MYGWTLWSVWNVLDANKAIKYKPSFKTTFFIYLSASLQMLLIYKRLKYCFHIRLTLNAQKLWINYSCLKFLVLLETQTYRSIFSLKRSKSLRSVFRLKKICHPFTTIIYVWGSQPFLDGKSCLWKKLLTHLHLLKFVGSSYN